MSAARRTTIGTKEQSVVAAYLGGEPIAGLCERLGIGVSALYSIIGKNGLQKRREYPRNRKKRVSAPSARDLAIVAERSRGETLTAIGKRHGMSKQRVAQIVSAVQSRLSRDAP